jgi:uncharacterized phage protein (TIGR02218 family)
MAYDTYEASPNLNSKVYIYLFEMGGIETWAYTSENHEVEVDGVTYVPEIISHDEQSADTNEGSQAEQTIQIAYTNPVAAIHVPYLPPKPVQVTIQSFQRNDPEGEVKTHFYGEIVSFQQKGAMVELRCAQGNDPTQRMIPRATHGPGCRHGTYSDACTLDREDWKTVITDLTSVVGFTLQSPTFLSLGTGWLQRGYAENPATGETRYITYHVGNTIKLVYPFTGLTAADEIWVYAGDDKKAETCRIKFNNKLNYLGFDFFPTFNVFADGVRKGNGNCGPGNGDTLAVPTFIDMILATNPRAFWPLDDVASGVMRDLSSFNHPGVYTDPLTTGISGGASILSGGGSLQLNGSPSGYGVVSSHPDFDISDKGNYALAAQFVVDSTAGGVRSIVSSYGSAMFGLHNFALDLRGGGFNLLPQASHSKTNWDLAAVVANPGEEITIAKRYFIVARKDASGWRLYLNNVLIGANLGPDGVSVGTNLTYPNGSVVVGGEGWYGRVSNVVLWANNCPSEATFTKLYNKLTVSDS